MSADKFFCGVIEGFYGRPWTSRQRRQLFGWQQSWGLNTFLYAPKDDIKHRALWREFYDETEATELKNLITEARTRGLEFVYAIAPGLDIEYGSELPALQDKIRHVAALGVRTFAILFDDIPHRMKENDARRFASFAEAQSHVANDLFDFVRRELAGSKLWFCPTVYCGRMAGGDVKQCSYLQETGERLHAKIEFFWTGPEIVSETINVESIRELSSVIRRQPLIWDNLHANDYDLRRLYLGPYSGRPWELRKEVKGILSNPNCEFAANFVPLRTLALYAQAKEIWRPREAFAQALAEWRPFFAAQAKSAVTARELELLGDIFYLPYEFGARAQQFLEDFQLLLQTSPVRWDKTWTRFEQTCQDITDLFARITELKDRELCYTLYRHVWEIKEEVALLRSYLQWLKSEPKPGETFCSPEHRPRVYRGGLVATLQRLLVMDDDGHFTNAGFRHTTNG